MQSQARFELVSIADAVALGVEHPYDAGCVAKYRIQVRRSNNKTKMKCLGVSTVSVDTQSR